MIWLVFDTAITITLNILLSTVSNTLSLPLLFHSNFPQREAKYWATRYKYNSFFFFSFLYRILSSLWTTFSFFVLYIYLVTYDWYAPNILVNPYDGDRLFDMLPGNYFQIIFEYLFALKPELKRIVDEFKERKFGGYNVGIQIRHPTPDASGIYHLTEWNRIQ